MLKKIKAYVEKNKMISPNDTVVVGVSGGADSVCLLFLLQELRKEIPFRLLVAHINHKIRQESIEDAAYVKKLCAEMKLPFFLIEEDVKKKAKEEGISTEEAGRKVRYEAFAHILKEQGHKEDGKIAIAHNSNDRAETMLFHLFRGTGLTGLCSIRPVRENIIRPLLCVERMEIERYLQEHKITYCIDRTNAEDIYTRNKIRHHILPYAEKEIAKGVIGHMAGTADILSETEDFIYQSVTEVYHQCVEEIEGMPLRVDILKTKAYHDFIRKQLIVRCLEKVAFTRKDFTNKHIIDIDSLFLMEEGREIHLPYDIVVRREYGYVIYDKRSKNIEQERKEWIIYPENGYSLEVVGLGRLDFEIKEYNFAQNIPQNKYTKWFDYDKINKSLVVRNRKAGDYITINRELSRKKLQDYMVDEKIPKHIRDSLWILADGEHILWIIGYRVSEQYKVDEKTKRILQVQVRGGHKS